MPLFKQVNQLFDQSENLINLYDTDALNKILINQSNLTVIYLNTFSPALHIDKLELLLCLFKTKFYIIGIFESRFIKSNSLKTTINIPGYHSQQVVR